MTGGAMTAPAYYNEIDPHAAQWLRNLIEAGHIAPGYVDERSIEDVYPSDLRGFAQCHFFAGVGVWSHALRSAGWPDDRPVWTGSCPCQPFSAAGAGAGFADERHLWPAFHHLIEQCRPAVVFGEQVASKDADPWIDLVQTDLEAMGYGVGAIAFPSAGIGAPHIRDRLYWVANAHLQCQGPAGNGAGTGNIGGRIKAGGLANTSSPRLQGGERAWKRADAQLQTVERNGKVGGLADAADQRLNGRWTSEAGDGRRSAWLESERFCDAGGMANTQRERVCTCGQGCTAGAPRTMQGIDGQRERGWPDACAGDDDMGARPGPTNGFWRTADWLACRDGKWRPVEPGTFPLVAGAAARVVRLRAYGNAINAKAAQAFIECVMEA